ncbi:ATP-binding protein [Chrysiogenes arsenatis]|uniref:ATP-binding protein n=1 Tax=Chrysiogenes arsenatis TaxID=309797 RepID=UPI0004150C21|nr:transporter substrate-binding domain-containing protein [Chrysiogenes arsenatis]
MVRRGIAILLLTLCVSLPGVAKSVAPDLESILSSEERHYLSGRSTINLCIDPEFPPFEYFNATGEAEGLAVDMLRMVTAKLGLTPVAVPSKNWSHSLELGRSRQCDVFSNIAATEERRSFLDFTTPHLTFPFVIATRQEEPFIHSVRDILHRDIAVIRGFASVDMLRERYPDINLVLVENIEEGLEGVSRGRYYAYIDVLASINYSIRKLGLSNVKIAGHTDFKIDLAFASRNDEPALGSALQKALESVTQHEKDEVLNRWVSVRYEHGRDYALLWKVLAGATVIVLIIVWWNRTLQVQIRRRHQAEAELSKANDELNHTLEELKSAQSYVVQQEKMAALGQLVAGVAHEINTPLGAIQSSAGNILDSLAQAIRELPQVLSALNEAEQQHFVALLERSAQGEILLTTREQREKRKAMEAQLSEQGFANSREIAEQFLRLRIYQGFETFMPLLRHPNARLILETAGALSVIFASAGTIMDAVKKASKIVFALKSYARHNYGGEMTLGSLKDGLETVLTLYQNQIKHNIELHRDYDEAPQILACHDELNQVWTNIIHNALQAMEYRGRLRIALRVQEAGQRVEIADSGSGIPETIATKIFEPFFTTKSAGEGSGLGLDIVRKIVEKHGGTVTFTSAPNEGTTFIVFLPVQKKVTHV